MTDQILSQLELSNGLFFWFLLDLAYLVLFIVCVGLSKQCVCFRGDAEALHLRTLESSIPIASMQHCLVSCQSPMSGFIFQWGQELRRLLYYSDDK